MSWGSAISKLFEFWRQRPRLRIEAAVRPDRIPNTDLYEPTLFLRITNVSSKLVIVTHIRGEGDELESSLEFREPIRLEPREFVKTTVDVGLPNAEIELSMLNRVWLVDTTGKRHIIQSIDVLKQQVAQAKKAIEGRRQ